MAGGTVSLNTDTNQTSSGIFHGKRGRLLKENLTAYLFLFPAMSLIFIFGLYPVAFSLYVSMYKWKIKQGSFRGLSNYTKAMDSLAYVIAFLIAIGLIWMTVSGLIKMWKTAKTQGQHVWTFLLPSVVLAGATYYFVKFFVLLLPEILSIGEKVQRVVRTQELYVQLFGEAFHVEGVVQARQQFLIWLMIGIVLWIVMARIIKDIRNNQYTGQFYLMSLSLIVGGLLANFTYQSIVEEYTAAIESGKEIALWPQVISVLAGLFLLYFSWKLWKHATTHADSWKFAASALSALGMLIAAWILIGEVPPIIAAGDNALWSGLQVTVWYSLGTVPFQLMIGLAIAYLLYQDIQAKSFFRMLYFLPYITPAVASAAVFRIMFSNRATGMMNNVLGIFGLDPLKWLLEPNPIFTIFGVEGPSLALVVLILFGIWTYSGYNAVIFLAGLGGIPRSLYEAAQIDGANRWQTFRNITLPLLSPITYFLSLLGVIGTFKAFNHVFVLRNPAALRTVDTMSMVIWDLIKTDTRYGYGSATAFILFGVVLVLTLVNNKVQGEKVFYG